MSTCDIVGLLFLATVILLVLFLTRSKRSGEDPDTTEIQPKRRGSIHKGMSKHR